MASAGGMFEESGIWPPNVHAESKLQIKFTTLFTRRFRDKWKQWLRDNDGKLLVGVCISVTKDHVLHPLSGDQVRGIKLKHIG